MIRETLHEFAIKTARTFEDRTATIGASDVGQCARKVFWWKMEGDPEYEAARDPDFVESWGAAVRGSTFETHFWLRALRARFKKKLHYAGKAQRTLVSGYLSATPDGLLTKLPRDILASLGVPDIGKSGELVLECKTVDPRTKLDEPKPEHVLQAQVQLNLFHETTKHHPDYALISYINASFWDDVAEFPVRFDPGIYEKAQARATEIMLARSAEELRPEGWIAGGSECNYCPFTRACGRERHAVPTGEDFQLPTQLLAEFSDMARDVKDLQRKAEVATSNLRGAQHDLKERLRVHNLRRVAGDGFSITWSAVKGRPSYDIPAIREAAAAAGVDLTKFETMGQPSDRLEVRVNEPSRLDHVK
jgi:hypothetical protein